VNQPSVFRLGTDEYHHQFKSLRAIREALANGADPEEHNALHLAVQLDRRGNAKSSEIVEELLRFGADVNSRSRRGQTPLHVCNHEHVEQLLQHGAFLNAKDDLGQSALEQRGWPIDILKPEKLLLAGIDINTRDVNGYTALHRSSHEELAKLLLKFGADATLQSDTGQTAYATTGLEVIQRAEIAQRAEHSKQSILDGLGTAWKPSDCKADSNPHDQEASVQQQRRRLM
jgi:ankyrin repeat protein